MIGFPRMFCQFDAHKGPQKVSRDTCGQLQYVCVPWTYKFDQQKKFSKKPSQQKSSLRHDWFSKDVLQV